MTKFAAVVSGLALVGVGVLVPPGASHSAGGSPQPGPFPVGNLLSYANSDFEGSANFIPVTNVSSISDDSTRSFLHKDSLKFVSASAGTTAVELQEGASPTQINVTGGDEYTVSAYVRIPAVSGETVSFGIAQYDPAGASIGSVYTPALSLNSSGGWQYVEGQVTIAAGTAWALDSPEIIIGGALAGQATNVDELTFRPYRAALAIGAHGACGDPCTYSAADWLSTNAAIGPLQSDKEFFTGALPWNFDRTTCWGIEQGAGMTPSAWPVCVIAWKGTLMTQARMNRFLRSVPAGQQLYLVWFQEPEGKSFSYCHKTGGAAFVCEFDKQERLVKDSPYYRPNILTAMDASAYQYGDPKNDASEDNGNGDNSATSGADCSYIPPAQFTDAYFLDFYENQPAGVQGVDVNTETYREDNWKNWLNCVLPSNRPVGLAEYGLSQCSSSDVSNTPATMSADNAYLESLGAQIHEEVALWNYWYTNYGGSKDCTVFTGASEVSAWQSIENQNGGG